MAVDSRFVQKQIVRTRDRLGGIKAYAPFIAEMPQPMLEQLVRDGLYRAKAFCFGAFALLVWPALLFKTGGVLISGPVVALLCYSCWPWLACQNMERELLYRRDYGKWRWDR